MHILWIQSTAPFRYAPHEIPVYHTFPPTLIPPLLVTLLSVRIRSPALHARTQGPTPTPLVLLNNTFHRPNIMAWLPQIIQLSPPRPPPNFPLHNLHPFNVGGVNFHPHLHPYTRQLIAE